MSIQEEVPLLKREMPAQEEALIREELTGQRDEAPIQEEVPIPEEEAPTQEESTRVVVTASSPTLVTIKPVTKVMISPPAVASMVVAGPPTLAVSCTIFAIAGSGTPVLFPRMMMVAKETPLSPTVRLC
ncbi:uncharacterized protein A4U43_C01F2740 [Asparagus officinalis]|uniref:Uncharacterized protein n=1 Tax=Asparagus officinalis TaxID=4686 RepID=A0A5P1FQY2_ASPOF|nr:uncharacterized protein A4U43_C01F2740 [Asparagus officinalis]